MNPVAIPDHETRGESQQLIEPTFSLNDFFGQPKWPVRADERNAVETFDDYQVRTPCCSFTTVRPCTSSTPCPFSNFF